MLWIVCGVSNNRRGTSRLYLSEREKELVRMKFELQASSKVSQCLVEDRPSVVSRSKLRQTFFFDPIGSE